MAGYGPPPKRSGQRRRRNKPSRPVTKVYVDRDGPVPCPPLKVDVCEQAQAWYHSLAESPQSEFYEPSDWAYAQLAALALDEWYRTHNPSLLRPLNSMFSDLLVTVADRVRWGVS